MTRAPLGRSAAPALLALLAPVLLAGCTEDDDPGEAGDADLTPGAVAVIAADHLPEDYRGIRATDEDGAVGIDIGYDDYAAGAGAGPASVAEEACSSTENCERTEVDGGELVVVWEEADSEQPGFVSLLLVRDEEATAAFTTSATLSGDPREPGNLGGEITYEQLEALATDPRLSLRTSQDVVEAGEEIDFDD